MMISAGRLRALFGSLIAAMLLMLWMPAARAVLPIEHWTTASGARVYFVRADALPMVDLSIDFDAGARFDPAAKRGLASMTRQMMARGAQDLDETAIEEGLARTGAQLGGGASDDRAGFTLRSLSNAEQLDRALELLERILATPQFPQDVLERERARAIDALREAETRPATIARRHFGRAIYGQHPYGHEADPDTMAAFTRDDLVAFHRDFYDARHAVIALIGAISRERAEAIVEQLSRRLPAGAERAALAEVVAMKEAVDERIAHPASQSHILIGAPGIARHDPDYFPLFVGNYVLGGGGFVSRLYTEVREKRGMAYSVYSYFTPLLQPGPFTVGLQTRKEQTSEALEIVRATLQRFTSEGPSEEEVIAAKDNLVGGFALRTDSNRKILDYLAVIGFYRLPLDYLETWTGNVSAVTREQIRDAFARRIHPQTMATIVVGEAGKADAPPSSSATR